MDDYLLTADVWTVLDLIVAEFKSDPSLVASFDERLVRRAIQLVEEHEASRMKSHDGMPPLEQEPRHVCGSVLVPIPNHMPEAQAMHADDVDDVEFGRDERGRLCFIIDGCIVDALKAVWAAGYKTLGCCCGHGQNAGGIITIDNGTFSCTPRTGTQERYAAIHKEASR